MAWKHDWRHAVTRSMAHWKRGAPLLKRVLVQRSVKGAEENVGGNPRGHIVLQRPHQCDDGAPAPSGVVSVHRKSTQPGTPRTLIKSKDRFSSGRALMSAETRGVKGIQALDRRLCVQECKQSECRGRAAGTLAE